ncbi:sensor histidine kinase [Haloarcula halophila]|uniref:sensor histidine kinase n=1 Tax=Haloarcula TaxID=2237 RepID=UPI0023E3EA10|nr:sensor histidine kinase [Halomicroarcula sp. DFY41]
MHLRTTFLLTLAAVALVLSGVVFAGFSLHKQEVTQQERTRLNTSAETVAHDIDTRLGEKQSTVALWATNDDIAAHGAPAQRGALATFRAQTAFEGVSVVAANGTMVAIDSAGLSAERRDELTGTDFSTRPYVQEALDGKQYISAPFEAESGHFIVTISAPIRQQGTVVGTLNGAFHLTATNFFESSTTLLPPEQALTVRSVDDTRLYSDPPPSGERFTATAPVDRTGWTVTVAVDRAAVAQPIRRASTYQFGALALTLFAVAVLGIWASRLTIRQIDELVAGFDALESGNYGTTVDLGTTTEWQRISHRFSELAATLDRRTSQMLVFNRVFRHNLRNDMSVILLSAERILDTDGVPEPVERSAERIQARAESFMEMSEHARTIQNELWSGNPTGIDRIDATRAIDEIAETLREEYPEAAIETDLGEAVPVYAARVLFPLVTELGRNALEHNDLPASDRSVTFRVSCQADTAAITVADNGPGIPDLETELLAGTRDETPTSHGNGLGLWLVKWLVDSLGGEISVATGTQRGTAITITLPGAEATEERA